MSGSPTASGPGQRLLRAASWPDLRSGYASLIAPGQPQMGGGGGGAA